MKKYRMIFSDMDGTLLKNATEISEKNVEMIGKAVACGIDFVICTGRGVYGVEKFLDQLHLMGRPGYVICQNGAAVYRLEDMQMILKHSFSADVLRPVVETARRMGVEVYLYDDRTFLTEKVTREVQDYCRVMHADMRVLPDGLAYDGHFTKCLLSGSAEHLKAVRAAVEPLVKQELNCFYSGPEYLEFVKKGVSKGNALRETAQKAGVPLSQVIAIRPPISFDSLFLCARSASTSCLMVLFSTSSAITSSTSGSLSSWNFLRIFSFTISGFSLTNLMSNIDFCLLSFSIQTFGVRDFLRNKKTPVPKNRDESYSRVATRIARKQVFEPLKQR